MFANRRRVRVLAMVVLVTAFLPLSVPAGMISDHLDMFHTCLGFGTIALAGATAATQGDDDVHEGLAVATAVFALSTVLTGYIEHSDRFDTSDGFITKDNAHILSGVLGAAALIAAVAIADDGEESSHSGFGIAGGILMTFAVIDIKF